MAASSKKPSLFVFLPLLLLLLLVSAVRGDGVQPAAVAADARHDTAAGDGGERVTTTVRTGHGHGYSSSHSGGHTDSGGGDGGSVAEKGGAGVVDPRNLNARSHRSSGAAATTSRAALCGLAGAVVLAVVALP